MGGSNKICKKYFPPFSNPPLISNKETPTHQRSSDKRFIPTRHKNKLLSALTKRGGNNMRPYSFDMCFINTLGYKWDAWLRRVGGSCFFSPTKDEENIFYKTVSEPPIILLLLGHMKLVI